MYVWQLETDQNVQMLLKAVGQQTLKVPNDIAHDRWPKRKDGAFSVSGRLSLPPVTSFGPFVDFGVLVV